MVNGSRGDVWIPTSDAGCWTGEGWTLDWTQGMHFHDSDECEEFCKRLPLPSQPYYVFPLDWGPTVRKKVEKSSVV